MHLSPRSFLPPPQTKRCPPEAPGLHRVATDCELVLGSSSDRPAQNPSAALQCWPEVFSEAAPPAGPVLPPGVQYSVRLVSGVLATFLSKFVSLLHKQRDLE